MNSRASLSTVKPVFIFFVVGIFNFSKRITCNCFGELRLNLSQTASKIPSSSDFIRVSISAQIDLSFVESNLKPVSSI
jgi:hypothetical protein